jgi:hypothetical protein
MKYLIHTPQGFIMSSNLTTWGRWLYVPFEGSCVTDFIAYKNQSSSAGFEPANLESNGKNDNHSTTDVDLITLSLLGEEQDYIL